MGEFFSLYDRLNEDPRLRGKQFERVCQWWLSNDPTYKRTIRNVWLWNEWEHNWGADAGIDLVAEDFDGRLWAIQAKAYNAAHAVTKSDVDRFLSESSRKWFNYRLLIATTDKMHHVARRTINDQEKQVSFVGLSDLLTSAVDWPTDPARMRPARLLRSAMPRAHQRAAIRDVVKGFETSDRGQLIMACGTGKTLTSMFVREKLCAERTLVLVPSLSLLKQSMQVWQRNAKVPFEARPVCSDLTVMGGEDEAVAYTSEVGVPVTTDPGEIAAFLRRRSGPRVVFSTYQSSPQIARAFALGRVPQFDLAIADESHRVAGDESATFATILDANAIKARSRLFMTATPRFYTGRVIKAARESEMEVASMDDPAKFGKVFHSLSFGEAIRRELLTDYQVAIVCVDDATYGHWANRGVLVKRGERTTDARTLASQIGLAKAMKKYELQRVISFHSRVSRAKRFAAEIPDVIEWMPLRQRPSGSLWTGFASGDMSAGERHVRLRRLSHLEDGERGLLSNARCLSEGVDVPTLDGVAFIDPRGSEVDIVQAVGRAIRLAEDKSIGTIVIPVFIDTATDPDTALNDSSFRSVWRVVNALRAHDEELAEQIDAYRRELGRRGSARIPQKIHLDIERTVGKAFTDAFSIRLVEKTSARWEFWYGMLQRYADENGTTRVPVDHVFNDYPLGKWASVQRSLHSKGALSDDRTQKLERLSGWTWDVAADQWGMWIALMHQFVAEHGHADVPIPYMVGEYNLRSWVATQRGLQKRGKLPADRVRELEALPGWVWDKRKDRWTQHYEGLRKFSMRTGHARAPQRHVEDGLRLGQWVAVQRNYRDEVSPERKALLEALPGWSWNLTTDGWERCYAFLTNFVEREGHARVAKDHLEDGLRLGQWVNDQRAKRDKLSAHHYQRLESLPGWVWNLRSDKWHTKLALLEQYQRREGHALVSQGWKEDGVNLGSWVAEQRNNHVDMSFERRQLLESVPGWTWDPYAESWEHGYVTLVAFADEQGHARVPRGFLAGGINLGGWVAEQRSSRSRMAAARLQRLEAVPGWSWNAVEDSWNQHLELLFTYAAREGDTNVPVDYVENGLKLGQWTRLRRREYRQLSADRQILLESIPGWFWGRKADYIWNQKYELLQRFVESEGHALVPDQYVKDGIKLGGWVREQRAERDNLPIERAARLEALLGWSWAVSIDNWFEKYELAAGFADREGHARVPQSHKEHGVALGSWIAVQRGLRDTMSRERRALLELLPGWSWDPHEDRWQRSYLLVQQFGDREGHTRVPDRYIEDGVNIGSWVLTQRTNRDQLTQNRKELLEVLPGWVWDAYSHRWDRGYGRLLEYVKENGTSQVSIQYVTDDGFQLGTWVNTVRIRKRAGSLNEENSKQMEGLPDWSWTPKSDRWDRAYSLLLEYVREHGDALVPQSCVVEEFSLGAWVAAQRRRNVAGTLSSDRQKRLGKVTGWVWRVK